MPSTIELFSKTGSNRREFLSAAMVSASLTCSRSLGAESDVDPWLAHGLTLAQRNQIRDAFRRGIERKFIPGGNLLLIHKGEIVLREAFGVADVESKRPFAVDTPCRIASLTKPHTATTMVIMAEKGKVSLGVPVEEYLPVFKGIKVRGGSAAKRSPTLRECLSHTTGFPGNNALKTGRVAINFGKSLEDTVNGLCQELVHDRALADYWEEGGSAERATEQQPVLLRKGTADFADYRRTESAKVCAICGSILHSGSQPKVGTADGLFHAVPLHGRVVHLVKLQAWRG